MKAKQILVTALATVSILATGCASRITVDDFSTKATGKGYPTFKMDTTDSYLDSLYPGITDCAQSRNGTAQILFAEFRSEDNVKDIMDMYGFVYDDANDDPEIIESSEESIDTFYARQKGNTLAAVQGGTKEEFAETVKFLKGIGY